jgi:hypothetical protein
VETVADATYKTKVETVADDLAKDTDGDATTKSAIKDVSDHMNHVVDAVTNADRAEEARDKARDWAEKDGEVESGKHSAKYWAQQTSDVVTGDIINDEDPNELKVYSSYKVDNILNILVRGTTQIADARGKVVVQADVSLQSGDNDINITMIDQSSSTGAFEIDDSAEKVTLKRKTGFIVIGKLKFQSSADVSRDVTLRIYDSNGDLATDTKTVRIANGKKKTIDFILPFSIASFPLTQT